MGMIIYNVTVNIEDSIHDEWYKWSREIHIPEVMRTGMFTEYRLCKVIGSDSGTTYSIQYLCQSMENYNRYISEFAPALRDSVIEKYGDKVIAFRTLLEVIS
jgi:hypothetical protein